MRQCFGFWVGLYIYMKDLGIVVDEQNNKSQDCYVIIKIPRRCHGMTEFCP